MQFIVGLTIIALLMYLLNAIWPLFLVLFVVFVVWKAYEFFYYKSSKFLSIKQRIDTYLTEQITEMHHTVIPANGIINGNI